MLQGFGRRCKRLTLHSPTVRERTPRTSDTHSRHSPPSPSQNSQSAPVDPIFLSTTPLLDEDPHRKPKKKATKMSKVLVILAMCQPCRSFVPPAATIIVRHSNPASSAEPCSRPTAALLQPKDKQDDDLLWDGEVIEGAWAIRRGSPRFVSQAATS